MYLKSTDMTSSPIGCSERDTTVLLHYTIRSNDVDFDRSLHEEPRSTSA